MTGSTSPDQPEALPAARDSATLLLAVLGQSAMSRTRTAHAALELKPRQFEAIATLHDLGPMTQTELAERLGLAASGLVVLLNPLEADGVVQRQRLADNRSHNRVELTERGADLLARAREVQLRLDEQLLADLSPGRRATFVGILKQLRDAGAADRPGETTRWLSRTTAESPPR